MIQQFCDEYRWLSNFYPVEITFDNITYPSVEHYYVALKINNQQVIDGELYSLLDARKYISTIENPGMVKKLGKKLKIREDWDEIKISVMKYGLNQKYNQEPFKTLLKETGNIHIQEGNYWGDTFWGIDLETNIGKNILGKLIMKIRDKLLS